MSFPQPLFLMPTPYSRRRFLQQTALGAAGLGALPLASLSAPATSRAGSAPADIRKSEGAELASRHPIVGTRPATNFMDGSILGNGDLGAVVEPRPDVILIHVGHNAVWDQRMLPLDMEKLKTFQFAMDKIKEIGTSVDRLDRDPWFKDYLWAGKESYAGRKYPRPYCCGSVALGMDRRDIQVLGHRVLIDRGMCLVDLLIGTERHAVEIFVEPDSTRIWVRVVNARGEPVPSPFRFTAILGDGSIPAELPAATSAVDPAAGVIGYRQILPYEEIKARKDYRSHEKDRAFCLRVRSSRKLHQDTPVPSGTVVGAWLAKDAEPDRVVIELTQGLASSVPLDGGQPPAPGTTPLEAAARACTGMWRNHWEKSAVVLDDELLERTWYWNMYFLRCALHARTVAPGNFAICQYPNKDLSWHGDYHMDYNTQQAFWSTFSSNHPELNLPYVEMVHHVLPVARTWARDYYGMRGACFPVSSYPVELRSYPYGAPVFNWMMCLSTWTVQGLWWHYLYTKDLDYLRNKGFEPIKAVVQFMIDYIKRPAVQAQPWGDDRVHIWPSFPPEVYGLMPGLPREYNADNLVDVTMLRFVFLAYLQACRELKIEAAEAADMRDAADILNRLPAYPTAVGSRGKVYVSLPVESAEKVYNVPINLMTVFPGEQHGLHSSPEEYALAANTLRAHQNEGGNEIVFLSLQAARLGLLDLEKFKREIQYNLLPNGTCTDMNLQTGGRFGFSKTREYDWMARMGIWFENFALPVVINECMLQSYHGELRFFPNWPQDKAGAFRSLRAAGAFLVSAQYREGTVQWIEITSEKGGALTLISPWKSGLKWTKSGGGYVHSSEASVEIATQPGDRIQLAPL